MRRRAFLAATAGVGALTVPGVAAGQGESGPAAESFAPLGTVPVEGLKEVVVGADGDTAVAAVTDGLATIDVTDPATPTVLAERRDLLADRQGGPLSEIWEVQVDGDRAVAAGPAHGGGSSLSAAVFFDVAEPAAPTRLGVHETDFPIHNCALVDGVCYLTANGQDRNELVTVAAGASPRERGRWSIADHDERWLDVAGGLWSLHDVFVRADRAYLAHWDAGTWVVDVSDPAAPSFVAQVGGRSPGVLATVPAEATRGESVRPPGNAHYVAVDADASLLGVGRESWASDDADGAARGGPSGIDLWDVSTPTAARRLATIEPPPTPDPTYEGVWTTAHNFEFANGRLYSAWYRGGLRVFDVSEPAAPEELTAWRDSDRASFWTAQRATSCVVAPSVGYPQEVTEQALFTFPDPGSDGAPSGTVDGDGVAVE